MTRFHSVFGFDIEGSIEWCRYVIHPEDVFENATVRSQTKMDFLICKVWLLSLILVLSRLKLGHFKDRQTCSLRDAQSRGNSHSHVWIVIISDPIHETLLIIWNLLDQSRKLCFLFLNQLLSHLKGRLRIYLVPAAFVFEVFLKHCFIMRVMHHRLELVHHLLLITLKLLG